ncbi:HNH endonuclease [Cronobacter sakazakii]|uniref:HNH endonuclease n=1 Tax=Cronobacter sakazakii TaxID=28141 RepID=UPI000DA221A1|nr:HNH endonuclease [Cronobacter sakazakii]
MNEKNLLELLTYHPESGLFTWNVSRGKARKGKVAGYEMTGGYVGIFFNKKLYKAHRLAWPFTHGELPSGEIDHINCNKKDNRINNLRVVTTAENLRNRGMQKRNTSGVKGVNRKKGRRGWEVRIGVNHRRLFLGTFDDIELAELVAKEARAKYHGEFANDGDVYG